MSPQGFRTLPLPTYPEIPLAILPGREVARRLREFQPDAIHIATEGPLGSAAPTASGTASRSPRPTTPAFPST